MSFVRKAMTGLLLLAGVSVSLSQPAAAQKTYIAIGDSLVYGFETPAATHSYTTTGVGGNITQTVHQTLPGTAGFPGYASAYDAYLSSQSGTAYSLLNLGIIGETTSTLFTSAVDSGASNSNLNSNYVSGNPTQASLLHTALTAPGSSVGVITIQVGANDVIHALETPGQNTATALANVQSNYTVLLNQIKSDEGGGSLTNVTIIGYYDPFANLSLTNPYAAVLRTLSPGLTNGLNAILAQEALSFGARYVDLYAPFTSHLDEYDAYVLANSATDALAPPAGYPALPNDHPTDMGYALIAQQLAAPEPSPAWLFGLGVLGIAGLTLRARRRRA